ncbi:unnamed protein product, partial [Brassica oleracea]
LQNQQDKVEANNFRIQTYQKQKKTVSKSKKKVLAGESMGSQSPVYKIPPTIFFGFAIDPGAQFYQDQDLQKSRNVFTHVLGSRKGGAVFGSSESFSCFSTHCCVRTREYGGVSMWNKSFSKK